MPVGVSRACLLLTKLKICFPHEAKMVRNEVNTVINETALTDYFQSAAELYRKIKRNPLALTGHPSGPLKILLERRHRRAGDLAYDNITRSIRAALGC